MKSVGLSFCCLFFSFSFLFFFFVSEEDGRRGGRKGGGDGRSNVHAYFFGISYSSINGGDADDSGDDPVLSPVMRKPVGLGLSYHSIIRTKATELTPIMSCLSTLVVVARSVGRLSVGR